jgi:hypothetical protein
LYKYNQGLWKPLKNPKMPLVKAIIKKIYFKDHALGDNKNSSGHNIAQRNNKKKLNERFLVNQKSVIIYFIF